LKGEHGILRSNSSREAFLPDKSQRITFDFAPTMAKPFESSYQGKWGYQGKSLAA
jgi:hypothetical protein